MLTTETSDYEKLYSLDVLGVEDRGEDDQLDVYSEFREHIVKKSDGRYKVGVPWVPGTELSNTNKMASRKCFENVERKLRRNDDLKTFYKTMGRTTPKQPRTDVR